MIDKAIGQSIRRLRKSRKLTQVGLAELLDITPEYLSEVERGESLPSVNLLQSIWVKLNSNPGELFGDYDLISHLNNPELMLKLDEIHQDIPKKFHEDILIMNRRMVKLINSDPKKK
ncbi:helix-turn-helix domain-containing protein [Bacillus sp. JJ1562]|uniref:helix-turn-helix domain-containing protein n=1 Tax=Bacillus sp. JJ1562 TaxID=3122960 RepID=UPI0030017EE7